MRILVTGAAGFIGSHIAEAYHAARHKVVGVDNLSTGKRESLSEEIPLHEIDVLDEAALESLFCDFRPEVVSHHAAQVNVRLSWDKPEYDARTNILGSLAVLRQAVKWQTEKIIYSSSGGAIYGEPTSFPVKEDCLPQPLSNYDVSKYTVELYLRSFYESSNLRYITFRYPNIYGPRQDPKGEAGVVAIFAVQILKGEQPRIFGDGNKTRDYLFIDDLVDANLRALDYEQCGVFNLGWGKEIKDLEVFRTVRDAVGTVVEPVFEQKRPGEIDRICLDTALARNSLGWQPKVEFRKGVERTVTYWKEQLRPT